MTYQIYYLPENAPKGSRGYTMFDIEYYQEQSEKDKTQWFSEIHCLPIVEGLTYFLKDKAEDKNFDYQQFIKDAEEIQEVRGLLYERYNNRPKDSKEASNFHYHIFGNVIKELFDKFATKYGLFINID